MTPKRIYRYILITLLSLTLSLTAAQGGGLQAQTTLLEQGNQYYHAENYSEAVTVWREAEAEFEAAGERLQQGLVLANLSLAYQQMGEWEKAENSVQESLRVLEGVREQNEALWRQKGKALNALGRLQWSRGQADVAVETWQEAQEFYRRGGYLEGVVGTQLNQAQALQTLGLSVDAKRLLRGVEAQVAGQDDSPLKAQTYLSLGGTLRSLGELEEAEKVLISGLEVAESLGLPIASQIELELGDVARSRANQQQAIAQSEDAENSVNKAFTAYRTVAENSDSNRLRLQANLRQLSWAVELGKLPDMSLLTAIESQLAQLPQNRSAIASQLDYAHSLACLQPQVDAEIPSCVRSEWQVEGEVKTIESPKISDIADRLAQLVQETEDLGDKRLKSQAMGQLAALYEQNQQWTEAYRLTVDAIASAGEVQANDLLYRWEWQLGRLLKKQGNIEAITAYAEAVKTLDKVRSNILTINTDVQFSFRDNVEPIYREYVELLLLNSGNSSNPEQGYQKVIESVEALHLAELENFLRCNLTPTLKPNQTLAQIENIDDSAVVIYPIIIRDRIQVLAKFPGQPLRYYPGEMSAETAISQGKDMIIYTEYSNNQKSETERESIEKMVSDFRKAIINDESSFQYAEQFYSWLIEPLEQDLQAHSNIENLVFILDSTLYNLPLPALMQPSTNKYLIQLGYNLSLLPHLALFNLNENQLGAGILGAGISNELTVGDKFFRELTNVKDELKQLELQENSTILSNEEFTEQALADRIQTENFAIAHLATHGKFSSDPENTYLLTYDQETGGGRLLKARELDQILQSNSSIQLLVLSACETAEGDNRAVLGLAGLAVRAGTNSAIASLWQVQDEPTVQFISYFYEALQQPNITKPEALRIAQNKLMEDIRYTTPLHWSAFIFIGNWL